MNFRRLLIPLLLICSTAPTAHAQATSQFQTFVRFEQAKSGEPLSAPIPAESLRVKDGDKVARAVELSSAADLPFRIVLAFDVSRSVRSGSEHSLRNSVVELLKTLVRPGKDSVSLIDFNDEYYVDAGPTDDLRTVAQALTKYEDYRGGTALFETITATCRKLYGKGQPTQERRVLLLFSDGQDNASHSNLQQAVTAAQENGVAIFAISTGERGNTRGNVALQQLALGTGGRVFAGIKPQETSAFFAYLQRVLTSQFLVTYTLAETPNLFKHRPVEILSTQKGVRAFAAQGAMRQQ